MSSLGFIEYVFCFSVNSAEIQKKLQLRGQVTPLL